jgi:hypothetical protein
MRSSAPKELHQRFSSALMQPLQGSPAAALFPRVRCATLGCEMQPLRGKYNTVATLSDTVELERAFDFSYLLIASQFFPSPT